MGNISEILPVEKVEMYKGKNTPARSIERLHTSTRELLKKIYACLHYMLTLPLLSI